MCKKNCKSCHFWCFRSIDNSGYMNKDVAGVVINRDKLDQNYYYCHKGVWQEEFRHPGTTWGEIDTKRHEDFILKLESIIKKDRKAENSHGNSCFYREFEESMSLSAAEELEKRETIQAGASADRKWIRRGVWATFGTVAATLIAAILGSILKYHFPIKINEATQLITNHVKNKSVDVVSTIKNIKSLEHKK